MSTSQTSTDKLRWGILATGNIAKAFAGHLPKSDTGVLTAVASRSLEKAEAFAKEFGDGVQAFGSYEALLESDACDAVYIATPHNSHLEFGLKTIASGKHVLCEKPLTPNHGDSMRLVDAAEQAGVTLVEAFMYRCHPLVEKLVDLIRGGEIGDVQVIDAAFSFRGPSDPTHRLMNPDLAGGGILDVGAYTVSISRLIAGVANDKPFADPVDVQGFGHIGASGVDEYAIGMLKFDGGDKPDILAQLRTGVRMAGRNGVRIQGTHGWIHLDNPFIPARDGGTETIIVHTKDGERAVDVTSTKPLYAHEADIFAAAIDNDGCPPHPAQSTTDTLGNMKTLDAWRRKIGLKYPFEQIDNVEPTTVTHGDRIPTGKIVGLDKPMTRLVMGVDNQPSFADAAAVFDVYWAIGGNAFDTAHIYGRQNSLQLGAWIKSRGVREDTVLISKGGHTPFCYPKDIRRQLEQQLDWLQTDHADIYMLHRDNEDLPVGELVDVLDELAGEGRMTVYGASNWSLDRVKAANEYAATNGRRPFRVVSNNLSLADLIVPMWDGCLTARGDDWANYLAESGIANLSWSSQARGFFVPDRDLDEPELKRCWVSEDNLERRRRAFELAEKKGVSPINVAAAWVLGRPFESYALIGPRNLRELRSSVTALGVTLTEAEMKWLDLNDE
ncbi:MAG: aldo/keto reductase [Planctomycetota bacterium]